MVTVPYHTIPHKHKIQSRPSLLFIETASPPLKTVSAVQKGRHRVVFIQTAARQASSYKFDCKYACKISLADDVVRFNHHGVRRTGLRGPGGTGYAASGTDAAGPVDVLWPGIQVPR